MHGRQNVKYKNAFLYQESKSDSLISNPKIIYYTTWTIPVG